MFLHKANSEEKGKVYGFCLSNGVDIIGMLDDSTDSVFYISGAATISHGGTINAYPDFRQTGSPLKVYKCNVVATTIIEKELEEAYRAFFSAHM